MSEFKLPHEKDFRPDSKLCGYLTENAAAIEQAINDLQKQIDQMEKQDQEDKNFLNDLYK